MRTVSGKGEKKEFTFSSFGPLADDIYRGTLLSLYICATGNGVCCDMKSGALLRVVGASNMRVLQAVMGNGKTCDNLRGKMCLMSNVVKGLSEAFGLTLWDF